MFKVACQSLGGGQQKHKAGLQSGPGLLLVSGLGFGLEHSSFASIILGFSSLLIYS